MKALMKDIKGFASLPAQWQAIFEKTYNQHYSAMGSKMKAELTPISVKLVKSGGRYTLKVKYNTGDWWHYSNGCWY